MKIRELLGGPAYRKLFQQIRARVEAAGFETDDAGTRRRLARSVTVQGLEAEEQRALAGLMGLKTLPGSTTLVKLVRLDDALRASACAAGLEEVLEALGGPLVDRRATSAKAAAAREQLWVDAAGHPAVHARPALAAWLDELRHQGLVTRAANASGRPEAELLDATLSVVEHLPAGEGTLLPVLAAEVLGDAHGLDVGTPVGGLALRAAAHLVGEVPVPTSSHGRRALWAAVGVLCDPLSSQVLVAGLRPTGDGRVAVGLRAAAEEGEPVRLTLRELSRVQMDFGGTREAFVCENPAVVAAAAEALGSACRPVVCTEGVPSVAALRLLEGL